MKKILFTLFAALFLLGMPEEAKASHAAGGEITYKYIGDSTGIPYHYCIYLTVYRRNEPGSAGLGASTSLSITSGCFGSQNLTVTRLVPPPGQAAGDGGFAPQNYTSCIDVSDPNFFNISEHRYTACVVLPGKCTDFKFSWSLCCRNANITNITGPSGYNLYLESTLNNTLGPNTSGKFLNPAAKSFCVNQPFTWSQAAYEPDNDSLRYTKGQPWTANNAPCTWAAGYSTLQPMTTLNGFNLNNATGTFSFTPSQVEVDVLKIIVEEYRYDSTFSVWLQNGTAIREMQVPILSQCNAIAQQGITIDTNITGPGGVTAPTVKVNTDSLRDQYGISLIGNDSVADGSGGYNVTLPGVPYFCYDSVITIGFSTKLKCNTFSPDGSEFRVIGPDGVSRPVVGVDTKCGTDLLTDNVDLILHRPLDTNGSYLLYLKTGNDGNVLQNECGFSINPFFAIMIDVNDCPILDYRLLNVSVERDIDIRIDWEADNTTFSENLFTTWQILRANNNDQFYPHDTVNNAFARSYLDTTLTADLVDGAPFQYAVQLVQNFKPETPTNTIRNILLTQNGTSDSTSTFSWTAYDGFDNDTISNDPDSVTYELEGGPIDASGVIQWANIWGPAANTGVYDHDYTYPSINQGDSVVYAYRVKGTEPNNPNNPFISESNWVYLEFKTPLDPPIIPPDEPVIPNVFTPNNDGFNDIFYIKSNYSNVSISVYNRWGKLVYEDIDAPQADYDQGGSGWDGTDMNSGNQLADGTYYYVIELNDVASGEKEQLKGHLNIFTSGTR